MPNRLTVLQAIETALNASTSINNVTFENESYLEWNVDDFPGVIILDGETGIERISYPTSTSDDDMAARMTVTFRGFVHDDANILQAKRINLLAEIEKVVATSTSLGVQDVEIMMVDTDRGGNENYGICELDADVIYHYNHADP